MSLITLYRPVGLKELELIADADWCAFPPRLDWQPLFYPVLNLQYACQIAKEWNTEDAFSGHCGVVTSFDVDETYLQQFQVENVGAEIHNELWVPAEELVNFNRHIIGKIKIVDAFFGAAFSMPESNVVKKDLEKFLDNNNKRITNENINS